MLRQAVRRPCHRAAVPRSGVGRWSPAWRCWVVPSSPVFAVWNLKPSPLSAPQAVARLTVTRPGGRRAAHGPTRALRCLRTVRTWCTSPGVVESSNSTCARWTVWRAGACGHRRRRAPFFSPDSQWVGFFAEGKLKKIPVTGGASQIVCDAAGALGRKLGTERRHLFCARQFLWPVAGLCQRVALLSPSRQTARRRRLVIDGHRSCREDEAVLFTSRTGPGSDEWQVQVQRVSDGERRMLVAGRITGYYVPTGHLVYVQTATGTLVAVPFDLTRLQVGAAAPVTVAEGILVGGEGAHYTLSGNGLLAYVAGRGPTSKTGPWSGWTGHGKSEPVNAPGRPYEAPRLSPDGEQVAVHDCRGKAGCLGLQPRAR